MTEASVKQLADDATLWSVGEVTAAELIRSACDALVAGLDSQALREFAGLAESASGFEVEDLLREVAGDFGFAFQGRDSEPARLAASRLLASACVEGRLTPREFARRMHARIGHGHEDPRVEALVSMDDRYDVSKYTAETTQEIDKAVVTAARNLLRSP